MEIESSSLYNEIQEIVNGPSNPVHYSWSATIHVGANGLNHPAFKVVNIDFLRDFEMNYSDVVILRIMLPAGLYATQIYPYQGDIDITLYKRPLNPSADVTEMGKPIQMERYTAVLLDTGSDLLQGNLRATASEVNLDLTDMTEVEFQLVNKSLEQLRLTSVGMIFRDTTVEDAVRGVMTKESQSAFLTQDRLLKGVDMVKASNEKPRSHIIIPQGTKLVDVPAHVHKNCGGIYSAGLGYYLQDDFWYIYPCFDTTRYNDTKRTLTIIRVPPHRFPNVEKSYRQDGDNLIIMAGGEVQYRGDSDSQQLSHGNGVMFADASKIMSDFTQTKKNKTAASRGDSNSEFITVKRANGLNNIQHSSSPITANPFVEYSKLARRNGSVMAMTWENSNPLLVFPGMMVRVLYLANDQIEEEFGVIIKAHDYVRMQGEGFASTRHITDTSLSVFIKGS